MKNLLINGGGAGTGLGKRIQDNSQQPLVWFRRIALATALLCFIVVMLGAYVRLSAAGLGCPDWPTCYGHVTAAGALENQAAVNAAYPHRPIEYGKAVREMVHRYGAGTLGLFVLLLAGWALAQRRNPRQPVATPVALVVIIIMQALLGMLTVTWLLKPLIVTLHLLGGMTTLALLWWLALPGEESGSPAGEATALLKRLAVLALAVLFLQIALGGWTSSNYAAVACPDFPRCQAQWWPQTDFREAFVLWRGLGIDYEGGVLDHPARIAIHLTHRIGAVLATATLTALGIMAVARAQTRRLRIAGIVVLLAVALQLAIGISMVVEGFPLPLATLHNTGAALLLLAVITLLRYLCATVDPIGNSPNPKSSR